MTRINPYRLFHGSFVPEWLMTTQIVSSNAKLIYARLCRYAGDDGKCYPKLDELAGEVGMPLSTMRRALDELIGQQMLESVRRGLGLPNDYYFLWHPMMGNPECPQVDNPECSSVSNQECPLMSTPISRESDKRVNQENPSVSPKPTKASRRANPLTSLVEFIGDAETLPAEWANDIASKHGWSQTFIDDQWQRFCNYHIGKGAKWRDWRRAWLNWCARTTDGRRSGGAGGAAGGGLAAAVSAVVAHRHGASGDGGGQCGDEAASGAGADGYRTRDPDDLSDIPF